MKLLKVDNSLGYYWVEDNKYEKIDKINRNDLLRLVEHTLVDEVEFDEYNADTIKNKAHQIIYKNLYDKLVELESRKSEFKDESNRLFHREYERYKGESS